MSIEREPSSELFQGDGDLLPKLERAQVLHLEPNDIIVVTLPEDAPVGDHDRIAQLLRAQIPGFRLIIVPFGMEFSVLRGAPLPADKDSLTLTPLTDAELAIIDST